MFLIRCRTRGGVAYLADRPYAFWVEDPALAMRFAGEEDAGAFLERHAADRLADVPDAEVVAEPEEVRATP